MIARMTDHAHAPPPLTEPKSPMWLPAVGALLYGFAEAGGTFRALDIVCARHVHIHADIVVMVAKRLDGS